MFARLNDCTDDLLGVIKGDLSLYSPNHYTSGTLTANELELVLGGALNPDVWINKESSIVPNTEMIHKQD